MAAAQRVSLRLGARLHLQTTQCWLFYLPLAERHSGMVRRQKLTISGSHADCTDATLARGTYRVCRISAATTGPSAETHASLERAILAMAHALARVLCCPAVILFLFL